MKKLLYIVQTALELGFLYALVAMALFLSYRILDIADLTTDATTSIGTIANKELCLKKINAICHIKKYIFLCHKLHLQS